MPHPHESIYRFIYCQIARTKDYSWRLYLPRGKSKRGYRGRKGGSAIRLNPNRISIHERPKEVENRVSFGHWEADSLLFSIYGQAVLTLHERKSRLTLAQPVPNKSAAVVASALSNSLSPFPPALRQTITLDNGTEFAAHASYPLQAYFCDPHKPWQKGGIENANGRYRRYIPRKTDISTLKPEDFIEINALYTPPIKSCASFCLI